MVDIVVGEGALELDKLAKGIEKSKSFEMLVRRWKHFALYLGVNKVKLLDLERQYKGGNIELDLIPREIIKIWIADKGKDATLNVLYDALVDCDVSNVAESLGKCCLNESIHSVKFLWHGNVLTLPELLGGEISSDIRKKLYDALRKIHFRTNEPLQLIKEELLPPSLPPYYIPRTLSYPLTKINSKIFISEFSNSHVFLVKGISKPELARAIGYQAIDTSGNQLHNVNVNFILLECDEDFHMICKNAYKPVHVIERKGERFFWIKSNNGHDTIRKYLKGERKTLDEKDMATKIMSLAPPCAMGIADSPGMGKTLVLAKLAAKIQRQNLPNSILLFIVLQEFAQRLTSVDSSSSVLEAIAKYASYDDVTELVLLEIIKQPTNQLYLFLDGYDEVIQEKLDMINTFLQCLKELKCVKIIAATRRHRRTNLEKIFHRFTYEMKPFDLSNQIEFLTTYWTSKHGAKNHEVLQSFARKCLATLETRFSDKEKKIAGIPLQCMMLGEVYAEEAVRASNLGVIQDDHVLQTMSFFEMYKKLIEVKFQRISDSKQKEIYYSAHICYAINLLFPDESNDFSAILGSDNVIDEATLYSIGLLEKSPATPRFIHRTFAEYLLAEFIVSNLGKFSSCTDLLFGEVLGEKGVTVRTKRMSKEYELKLPIVGYFVELHIKEHFRRYKSLDMLLPSFFVRIFFKTKVTVEDVSVAIAACGCNELEHTFDYAVKILNNYSIGDKLRDEYFKSLPHAVVGNSKNLTMLQKVLSFTRSKFNVSLTYHSTVIDFEEFDAFGFSNLLSPLHVAVFYGKYNMAAWLVQQYNEINYPTTNFSHLLLFACISSNAKTEDKLLIIDMLVGINRSWLEETDSQMCTPLLQKDVRFSVLQQLVGHGANINAYSRKVGTVLHKSLQSCECNYVDLVRWAFSNGFNLFRHEDDFGRTPLMHAIKELGSVNNEVLKLFSDSGAALDVNVKDKFGNTVLFLALERVETVDFIYKLGELGADIHHRNNNNQNVVHQIMTEGGSIENKMVILNKLIRIKHEWMEQKDIRGCTPIFQEHVNLSLVQRLVDHGADINASPRDKTGTFLLTNDGIRWALSNGFQQVNERDEENRTLLMNYLKRYGAVDDELLTLFHLAGADFHAQDTDGNSVLFYALKHTTTRNVKLIDYLLELGADINHINNDGHTMMHMVLENFKLDSDQKLAILKPLELKRFNRHHVIDLEGSLTFE